MKIASIPYVSEAQRNSHNFAETKEVKGAVFDMLHVSFMGRRGF